MLFQFELGVKAFITNIADVCRFTLMAKIMGFQTLLTCECFVTDSAVIRQIARMIEYMCF